MFKLPILALSLVIPTVLSADTCVIQICVDSDSHVVEAALYDSAADPSLLCPAWAQGILTKACGTGFTLIQCNNVDCLGIYSSSGSYWVSQQCIGTSSPCGTSQQCPVGSPASDVCQIAIAAPPTSTDVATSATSVTDEPSTSIQTSTVPTVTSQASTTSNKLSTGSLAGAIAGVVGALIAIPTLFWICRRAWIRKRGRDRGGFGGISDVSDPGDPKEGVVQRVGKPEHGGGGIEKLEDVGGVEKLEDIGGMWNTPLSIHSDGSGSRYGDVSSALDTACLWCLRNPSNGKYDFCGKTCMDEAISSPYTLIEVPRGHSKYNKVEKMFRSAWNFPPGIRSCPPIQKLYSVLENRESRDTYVQYRSQFGDNANEVFRYHGSKREVGCNIGGRHSSLCWSVSCPACSIIRTKFKVCSIDPNGPFGQGIYTSSASNKEGNTALERESFPTGGGVVFLAKVVLGRVFEVDHFMHDSRDPRPPGFDSVVFDNDNGRLNETVVYTDDAIRPAFLILL